MKKLSKLDLQNAVVSFGEPEEPDFDDESFNQVGLYLLPVKLDGIEYSTDELKLVIEEMKKDIAEREQNLSSLADRLAEAAKRAAAADEAAKSAMTGSAMAGTSMPDGVCPPKN